MKIQKHFTASTFIFYQEKILLCFHNKSQEWFPVGGHVEDSETPEESAMREVIEETGLEITFFNADNKLFCDDVEELIKPMHIFLEDVSEEHKHIDFIYYAVANSAKLNPQENEINKLKWFSEDGIKNDKTLLDHIKLPALEFFKLMKSKNL